MSGQDRQFVGFGFGPIQAGLFVLEARRSGCFGRLTVAEVDADLVRAVRKNGNRYVVNVAGADGIDWATVDGVRLLNPGVAAERRELVHAIAEADEIATALPSVACYAAGAEASPSACLADGLRLRGSGARPAVIYTAENDNRAAKFLEDAVAARLPDARLPATIQVLDTVIGKMSGVVADEAEQRRLDLARLSAGLPRAVLVEAFNHILITRIHLAGFRRGLAAFEERDDLQPFGEAKLYGHNAAHALLGFLARARGLSHMAEAGQDAAIMAKARAAFLHESGAGLLHRHTGKDPLFTPAGFEAYAEDLLARMTSPFLCDPVARVTRDPARKLGWDDRLVGAMRLALQAGVQPVLLAEGARLAAQGWTRDALLANWPAEVRAGSEAAAILALILEQ